MATTYASNIPTKEWVHARQTYLGGSELAAALGESSYQTPLQLWMLKTGRSEPFLSTPITEFGHLFESIMAEKFTQLTGLRVRKISDAYEHPEHSFLRGEHRPADCLLYSTQRAGRTGDQNHELLPAQE